MVKKGRKSSAAEPSAAAKRRRTSQLGIAAAMAPAVAAPKPTTDLALEQCQLRDLLDRRRTEELTSQGDKYLQVWSEKCYGMRDGASPSKPAAVAAVAAAAGGDSSLKARRALTSAYTKEDADLDSAAVRYMDVFRHLQQQAFRHDAAFEAKQLELLVLILRSDVMHALGDVSHQAFTLLSAYLQRFPYASLGRHEGGHFAGRPFLILDQQAAWQPLAAIADLRGLSKKYIFEEAIKDAGHNYRLDHGSASLLTVPYKKGGQLKTCFGLLRLCVDRAKDSVDEDHNGDVLLLRYLLTLLHQDLAARLAVFAAYADLKEGEAMQRKRAALLQNSLLWRIWLDEQETDKTRQELVGLLMRLVVGVASEEELQEVDKEQPQIDKDAEQAAPCICTPRELAAMAARFLNMLLDLFGTAEAAGGFQSTASYRMYRSNVRLRLDQAMKEMFWKNASDAVCATDDMSRTFLAALAPAHRLRLLSLVAISMVGNAYYHEEAAKRPALARAKELDALLRTGDSGPFQGAFQADPVVALQCLNLDKNRTVKVFTNVSADTACNNLAVLACGIALAAHSLAVARVELPALVGAAQGGSQGNGTGEGGSSSAGAGTGSSKGGTQLLQREVCEFLHFLAEKHREVRSGDKKDRALELSRASLFDLLHAQTAIAAI